MRRREKALRAGYWEGMVSAFEYRQAIASYLGHLKWGDQGGTLARQLTA